MRFSKQPLVLGKTLILRRPQAQDVTIHQVVAEFARDFENCLVDGAVGVRHEEDRPFLASKLLADLADRPRFARAGRPPDEGRVTPKGARDGCALPTYVGSTLHNRSFVCSACHNNSIASNRSNACRISIRSCGQRRAP